MPTKFKPDSFEYRGARGNRTAVKVKNFIKATPKQELFDYINNPNGKPKIKQKCMNELVRRGIKIQWTSEESNELDLSRLT
jgi:hypothetical protein